jgi:hypothetical protein
MEAEMHWYWWVACGLLGWAVIPAVFLGPTLGRLLQRRAEEQLPYLLPEERGEALTRRLEEIVAEHRKRRREPTA